MELGRRRDRGQTHSSDAEWRRMALFPGDEECDDVRTGSESVAAESGST